MKYALNGTIESSTYRPVEMQPHIRQFNKEVRIDRILKLMSKICIEPHLQIDSEKIKEPIQSYDLAWIITICNRETRHIDDVKFNDDELTSLVDVTDQKIFDTLHESNHLNKLNPKCITIVDMRGSLSDKQILTYELPPQLVFEIISKPNIYSPKGGKNLEQNPSYNGDAINTVTVQKLLPRYFKERIPQSKRDIDINKVATKLFPLLKKDY